MANKSYAGRLLLSLAISVVVYILIFSVASYISSLNYENIKSGDNQISEDITYLNTAINVSTCKNPLIEGSSQRLDYVGTMLNVLEERFGKNDERVLAEKGLYSELEYKHFLLIKKLNSLCNNSYDILFFFYSNNEALKNSAENIGYILSSLKRQNPDKIMIYSFDYNLNASVINDMKVKYGVTKPLTVVVNEKSAVYPRNIDDFNGFLQFSPN